MFEGMKQEQEPSHCCEQFANTYFIIAIHVMNEMAVLFLLFSKALQTQILT